ncbi:MAG: erythromycin esterase family protein [Janthinobacterium lividum]
MRWFCGVLLAVLALAKPWQAAAQVAAPVPARALRSVSPADTTFAELEFLRSEIGGARVVFLGEPTHGEGNVLAAKARLVAFLQQRMGFTTLAMESGFFELHKAQREIAIGKSVGKNLQSSIFPIWMQTREFQAVVPLVGPDGLRVMGFDPQLSGDYSDDLVDDLQDFLDDEKGSEAINYELLSEVVSYMAGQFAFPPTCQPAEWATELAKADQLLRKAAAAPTAARHAEAEFWQQCLRSLGALARDYAAHDPGAKTRADWVAADSNPRDAQMADNLLWYLRQHPAEKVICWGALPHFANRVEVLGSDELRAYRPMGRAVKEALGPNQAYILGTLAGGGTHGLPGAAGVPVPEPAAGTLEAYLATQPAPYAFVSLKHDAPGLQLTTYAFDYQPLAGPWSEVVDGFLFLKEVVPPQWLAADSAAARPDSVASSVAAAAVPGSLNPAPGQGSTTVRRVVRLADVSGVRTVRGVVLNQRSRQAVPYAAVVLPGQGKGTVADANGRFALPLPGPTRLQVSSLGYEVATVQSPLGNEELTVLLTPATYALESVRVAGSAPPTPEVILKNIIKRIPANYEQQDYATQVYTHRRLSNFDTLRLEDELVRRLRVPAGFRDFTRGFLQHEDDIFQETEQRHIVVQRGQPLTQVAEVEQYGNPQGYLLAAADPVRTAPLFKSGGAKRFLLKLDSQRYQGADTLYVVSFAAQRANLRSSGTYHTGVYQGRLLVRRRDYAVLRYEALWEDDTTQINAIARKNYGRPTLVARLYANVYTADRTTHVVDYAKAANGRYYVRRSVGESVRAGRQLGHKAFYTQSFTESYFTPLPAPGPPPAVSKGSGPPVEVPYRPEFWESYRRPGGALAAP